MKLRRPSLEAILIVGIGILISAFALLMLSAPKLYQAVARFKVAPPSPAGSWFVSTEFEVIRSELVLGKVVGMLNLPAQWGGKRPSPLTASETMELLKRRMELRDVPGTEDLIEIRVRSDDATEAARIANTLAETYQGVRREQQRRREIEANELHPTTAIRGTEIRDPAVEIIDRAVAPARPIRPNRPACATAFVFGLLLIVFGGYLATQEP